MSRSNPDVKLVTPAKRFFEWSGKTGTLSYYDKEATPPEAAELDKEIAELEATLAGTPKAAKKAVEKSIEEKKTQRAAMKGTNVAMKIPFTFIVLDQLHTVSGYDSIQKCGFWANDVRNISEDILTVRSKKGIEASGIWKDIKGINTSMKYAKAVYIAYMEAGKMEIGSIKMTGSILGAWFTYTTGKDAAGKKIGTAHDVNVGAVVLNGTAPKVNGATSYLEPVFIPKDISAEHEAKAQELDKQLQEYFTKYFAAQSKPAETSAVPVPATDIVETAEVVEEVDIDLSAAPATSNEDFDLPF